MTKLAYLGRRIDAVSRKIEYHLAPLRGKTADGFFEVIPNETYCFSPKKPSAINNGARVGSVYEIDTEKNDGTLSLTWPKWWHEVKVGELDEPARLAAQASDATAHNTATALKTERHPDLKNAVHALAFARSRMGPVQQAALDVWVLNKMRRGW